MPPCDTRIDIAYGMALRPLSSFVPTADGLLTLDLTRLGGILLLHLKSYEGLNTVFQNGRLNQDNFIAMLENRNVGLGPLPRTEPEYGARTPEVVRALLEAWNWLEREGLLMRDRQQPANWFTISSRGEELIKKVHRFEQWEKLGLDRVKNDLIQTGGMREIGGTQEVRDWAWQWVKMKESQTTPTATQHATTLIHLPIIADTRLTELRGLRSPYFDFKKLIRLCEEMNKSYSDSSYYATAMLTRGLLDHVPPIFGRTSFVEVANNYNGGGKSFKDAMQHLENAARNVADAHLHLPIRKSETLPVAQQVNFASQLDMLLSEIIRTIPTLTADPTVSKLQAPGRAVAPAVQKPEKIGPNIKFLSVKTVNVSYDEYQGVSYNETSSANSQVIGIVACFRNEAVYSNTITSAYNVKAHLKFIDADGSEVGAGVSRACWLGEKGDTFDLEPGGASGCVIVLLTRNGSIGVPWKERKKDSMGDSLIDQALELNTLPSKVEISLLDDNNQLLLAPIGLDIASVNGKPQAKRIQEA
jgi:hypothetical protein